MRTLLVGYDLNRPHQDYASLIDALKGQQGWWHYLDSTWLVRSELSAKQFRDHLKPHIDSDDELLVIDVTGRASAWAGLSEKAGAWIKTYL